MSFERKGKKCETLFGWACHLSDCWEERFSQKCHRPFGVVFSNGRSCNVECWPVRNAAAIGRFDLFQTTHSSQIFFQKSANLLIVLLPGNGYPLPQTNRQPDYMNSKTGSTKLSKSSLLQIMFYSLTIFWWLI